jgi:hypothetical protein
MFQPFGVILRGTTIKAAHKPYCTLVSTLYYVYDIVT